MNEAFLWYLWKYRLFHHDLFTVDGEPIEVIYPGQQNEDSGPDFSHARIRIGNTLWVGNVEVHIRSGDWLRHGHQYDRAFDTVILHVVYEHNAEVHRQSGQTIPVVALQHFVHEGWKNYRQLMKSSLPIPCSHALKDVDPLTIQQNIDRTLVSRLERKMKYTAQLLVLHHGDYEAVFYQMLAAGFGFKVNALPFELLARSVEYRTVIRHASSVHQLEALFFGQAGLLQENFSDTYAQELKSEYIYLSKKLKLVPLESKLWKFSRMHPANFPTLRLAQFAAVVHRHPHLFMEIIQQKDAEMVKKLFQVKCSEYWRSHFTFGNPSPATDKNLGEAAIVNLLINTVIPLLFKYGKDKGNEAITSRAMSWLENCAPENNSIIRLWAKTGIIATSAYQSQALIELKNEYCNRKNCLNCSIGLKLLRQNEKDS